MRIGYSAPTLVPVHWPSRPVPGLAAGTPLLFDPELPYGEDLLQFLWESRLFDARRLRTTDGRAVEVLRPGRIQRHSGPDLNDALLRIDGQIWAGQVEVHIRSSEWNMHGHQHDPAYNNVVLHVVYAYDSEVRTEQGLVPPTVELRSRLHPQSLAAHRALMQGRSWVPCAPQVGRVEPARTELWLERVLVERLERKTTEVEALYRQLGNDPAGTFHHMLLRGFGAKVNAEPFALLARALPLRVLLKYRDDPFRREALLFGQAGFLHGDYAEAYPRALYREYQILRHLHGLEPVPVAAWKFGRLRPANFPTVRLAQFARLLARLDGDPASLTDLDDAAVIRTRLDVRAEGYWTDHYRFDHPGRSVAKRFGRAAADGLIINTIVPYLFAMGRIRGDQRLSDRALHLLEQLPPENNVITAGWARHGLVARSAGRSQALIELKNTYCAQRKCLFCTIGTELLKR
ncbi:MAG: DUF2851 family protein [Flavobacteriales bacterium]